MQTRHLPFLSPIRHIFTIKLRINTEESILLRVLVQALVVVGIIATDVAAQMHTSFWAVPLSIVAAVWSWYHRRKHNLWAKSLIALGMLLAMAAFFVNLRSNWYDPRLVLAELLIQLQVLHSFDLPRRRDLGYSMVIGLILLGVAATVSQTLAFAPWLLLFLAIALPTLILNYRSQLGINKGKLEQLRQVAQFNKFNYLILAPQRLGLLLVLIVAVGLTIFAFMPRLPSYQQLSFPVSSPVDLDNEQFNPDNSSIFRPQNSAAETDDAEGKGFGVSPGKEQALAEETFYYGFQNEINQAQPNMAQLKPKVVMRIRSQAPGFWRMLAFDRYTGQGWKISREQELIKVSRPQWTYRFFIPGSKGGSRSKQVVQTYTMVSPLPNLIPALSYPQELYFPTAEVGVDPEGSLRSPTVLGEGLTYTVISRVPYRDRTLLGKAQQNYPERISQYYLQIPPEIAEKVQKRTEELLATSPKPLQSTYEKALFLAQVLKQRYTLLSQTPVFQAEEDIVSTFLFRDQGGYSDQFSTTLTIMLRSIGIPARLATGFDTGKFNPLTGFYVVRNTDAYALTEVYFPHYGWFAFDPIPGHQLLPQSFEVNYAFSTWRHFWHWVAGWLPSPLTSFVSNGWSWLITVLASGLRWLWRLFSSGWLGFSTGIALTLSLGFLVRQGWKRLSNWRDHLRLAKLPPMARLYRQMLRWSAAQGYAKHPAQTPLEHANRADQHLQTVAAEVIAEITQAYVDWRYGRKIPPVSYLQQQLRRLKRFKS